ncbi:MAG: helicase-related protein [Candidatus Zipacnadales bacterium]
MNLPEPDAVLEGDFWPETVRVIRAKQVGSRIKVEAEGEHTHQFYSRVLSPDDLARLRKVVRGAVDFSGRSEAFFLAIEAHRIRYAYQFDPLYAVNVSQVDPLPHQIEAVYYYILRNPRIRFLLADDPGAGKTIMAGLVLKELKYRGLVRRVLIVVPGHLRDQWLREMKERFEEGFTMVDRGVVNATWGRNIWQEEPQIITSMDFAKQDDVLDACSGARWDLVIVDEAHKMAAYRYGEKTDKTERYRLGEVLSRSSQFLLFLTATPHRGDPENFRLFLDLLEPGFFATTELLEESIHNRDNPLFLRRLKEDLKNFDQVPLFPPRHVHTVNYRLNDDEKRLYNAVTDYVEKSYNKALQKEKRNVAFALLILQRRMASSVRAIRRSLERRKQRLEELLKLGQWLTERGEVDEETLEDAPEFERLRQEEELVARLTAAETREELQAEIDQVADLIRLAKEAERHDVETKLNKLREVIGSEEIQRTGEKLLIFTESRDTLDYLSERLQGWGYSVVTLHGSMNLDERIRAEHHFRHQAQIMVSTEAGGEGINLQFCALMVNYDIPWNPNRLEQRMGRIHRYGQNKEVHIYNLVAYDTREGRVLTTLFQKLERIREVYGNDRVFDVIGDILPGASLKDLIVDAIANRRTLDDIIAEVQRIPDQEALRKVHEAAMVGLATRHIDLQRILGDERRARENRLVPEYVERFFQRACQFLNVPLERRQDGLWRIERVPYEVRNVSPEFKRRFGQVYPEYLRVTFDKDTAHRQGAEFVAPGHPLLEAILEAILARCREDLRQGAVFADTDGRLDGTLWFLEGEIRDGANMVAGKRLFALYQPTSDDDQGPLRAIAPALLWDLKPVAGSAVGAGLESAPTDTDAVVSAAVEQVLEPYRQELLEQRQRDAEIKRRYGLRSLEQRLMEAEAKLIDYATRQAKGQDIPAPTIQNEERTKEDLQEKKCHLEESIRQETALSPTEPRILGVVRVVPQPSARTDMRTDPEVEAIAISMAMAYERQHGRRPEDVSSQNLGYDIRSLTPGPSPNALGEGGWRGEGLRYIEVKGRAESGPIALTPNEWLMAHRLGKDYWLYVVEHCRTQPRLYTIQDPAAALSAEEVVEVVRYIIRDWKEAAAKFAIG